MVAAMRPSWFSHLRTLLWKNARLRRRRPAALAAEIAVPLVLFLLLAWVRTKVPPTPVPVGACCMDTEYHR